MLAVHGRFLTENGFSLVETLVVVGLIGTLASSAVMVVPGALQAARANSGASTVTVALRVAREQAIAQRRLVRVEFVPPNRLRVLRVDVPGPGTTVLSSLTIENGVSFENFPVLPDTPDAFGNASAVSFGTATSLAFTSEGSFVDQNGDPVNGTVYLGRAGEPSSARAITVFGPTALVRAWSWRGNRWVH